MPSSRLLSVAPPLVGGAFTGRRHPQGVALHRWCLAIGGQVTHNTPMILGYVTGGFAFHTLEDAIHILADTGYRSAAVSLEKHHLDPFDDDWPARARHIRSILQERDMRCTVETGARFILDPRRKHHPTLVSGAAADRDRRIEFLCRAIDIAAELQADSVSLWSGAADDHASDAAQLDRLCSGLCDVLAHAERYTMRLGFEPEPGMHVSTMAQFERLHEVMQHPLLGLTLDVGHVHCLADGDLFDHAGRWREQLCNVHIEDMRRGRHEHLLFGDGEIQFTEVVAILTSVDYRGPVHVELSRHSHDAPSVAARAFDFLSAIWPDPPAEHRV
ncbi:MAG: sugar phosphate isomerase/epimerase family protein [Phycisphaerae bacterium]